MSHPLGVAEHAKHLCLSLLRAKAMLALPDLPDPNRCPLAPPAILSDEMWIFLETRPVNDHIITRSVPASTTPLDHIMIQWSC